MLLLCLLIGALGGSPLEAGTLPISNPVVFVQQTPLDYTFATISDIFGNFQGYYPPEDQPIGGGLFRLDPDGTLTDLTGMSGVAVRDPEVSYDGTSILFSMKVGGFGRWQVWEVGISGDALQEISLDDGVHDLDPAYLPDGRIVFTTDRNLWADGYENLPSAQIAVMNADGTGVEVLKQHMAGHFNPLVGSDGMLYFTQWDFHDRRTSIGQDNSDFDVNRFLLWKMFADGSGLDHPTFGTHIWRSATPPTSPARTSTSTATASSTCSRTSIPVWCSRMVSSRAMSAPGRLPKARDRGVGSTASTAEGSRLSPLAPFRAAVEPSAP